MNDLERRLLAVWNTRVKMDWAGMETMLVDILSSDMSDVDKIAHCKEAIDAYTKRGYFIESEYPTEG